MKYSIQLPSYKLYQYEIELLKREINTILSNSIKIYFEDDCICIECEDQCDVSEKLIKRSTYIKSLKNGNQIFRTIQSIIEESCAKTNKRQSTRYFTHGIHEYKGKFNPQIARSILNIFGISKESNLLDPFCGSGTTLVEGLRLGYNTFGIDINPLAVYISSAKLNAYKIKKSIFLKNIKEAIEYSNKNNNKIDEDERLLYLKSWIPANSLRFLENFRRYCKNFKYQEVYLSIASNLIRDYSNQEPTDLRIRRRFTPFPNIPLDKAILDNAILLYNNIEQFNMHENISDLFLANVKNEDVRHYIYKEHFFDIAITSPPYATALPYIDTHRISMIWLDLMKLKQMRQLELEILGSRELSKDEKLSFFDNIERFKHILPKQEIDYCVKLQKSLSNTDGFRRQAVPALLLRYFVDMDMALKSIRIMMKKTSPFAIIIGKNKTVLGGNAFLIDTPKHLLSISENIGWKYKEIIKLQTYKRYGLNSSNGIKDEDLLVLES